MWDLPGPGIKPMSPALAGGFFTTEPPEKPQQHTLNICPPLTWSFPDSSVGKESACNAGDPGSIPGLGRSTGEGICYLLQCSWASLVAQLAKNPPAMQETWVRSLGWEDPLEKGKATHSSTLAWRIPWTVCIVHGDLKSWTQLSNFHSLTHPPYMPRIEGMNSCQVL